MGESLLSLPWVVGAGVLGFGLSAVFSSWLKLSRRIFLIPYLGGAGAFLYAFLRSNNIDVGSALSHNWIWGVVAGVIVGAFLVNTVRAQPASRKSSGGLLALDIAWLGLAYGIIDALFLNVMPVLAVWDASPGVSATANRIGLGALALVASLLVTLAYHIGYDEFRNKSVARVLLGNAIITLAYLVSGNPLGAIVSHTAMHIAAVIHGPDTTIQLPPHRHPAHLTTSIPER
jgi:hypothetical protein